MCWRWNCGEEMREFILSSQYALELKKENESKVGLGLHAISCVTSVVELLAQLAIFAGNQMEKKDVTSGQWKMLRVGGRPKLLISD